MSQETNPWTTEGAAANPWTASDTGGWAAPATTATPLPARKVSSARVNVADKDVKDLGSLIGYLAGVSESAFLSWGEEMDAAERAILPTWLGGSGRSYEENLRENRALMRKLREEHGTSVTAGEVTGAFVPIGGWGTRSKAVVETAQAGRAVALGQIVKEGAVMGAVYGAGASETDPGGSWMDTGYQRVRDAAVGSIFGAAGGYVLGATVIPAGRWALGKAATLWQQGRTPKINFKFKVGEAPAVADDVAADLTSSRLANAKRQPGPKAPSSEPSSTPKRNNVLTGKADDIAEEGAIFSTREISEATDTARKSIIDRIAKLTPQEAKLAAQKLNKAAASGDLAKDPHFRSILGLDMENATDDVADALRAAEMFEDMTQALLEKANMGTKSLAAQRMELRRKFGTSITETDLDRLVAQAQDSQGSANIGRTMMALAGVQFSKATKELLPLVLKGEAEAREALTGRLTSAIRVSAKGRILVSHAGRELGSLAHAEKLAFTEVRDGTVAIEKAEDIQKRVTAALEKLDDNELTELLSRVNDLSDLENVQRILLNAEAAEAVSGWIKARNTVGLWIKSNSLTPASGVVNVVGGLMHDLFRNGWARDFAAHTARMAGRVDEALALAFSREVQKAVTWQAHGAGIRSAVNRLKWEWWTSFEQVAEVAGATKAAARATTSRAALIAKGWTPPPIREFDQQVTLAITDTRAFNSKLADRAASGSPFATLVNALERTYATGINTVDALGTATARVVSGGLDDYGKQFTRVREVYANSAAFATREAIDAGLNEQQMIQYVSKRTAELAEMPPVELLAEVERKLVAGEDLADVDKMLLRRDYDAQREAEAVMFMDGPQTEVGRTMARVATYADKVAGLNMVPGILMTYIRTPTRIFERGLGSYTPWAGKIAETQAILARGGLEAAVEQARIDLGMQIIGVGAMAAATGLITVTNGGYKNSANLTGAPAQRLNLPGGAYAEISRLDPFSLSLALGGIIGQAYSAFDETQDTYGRDEAIATALQTAFVATREAIFEKSYLTGARDLLKAVFADEAGTLGGAAEKMIGSALSRTVPLAGTSRQINETFSGNGAEAVGIIDQLFKVTPGLGAYLPARVDALGNEVEGRAMGFAIGTTADSDELTKRVAALGVDITNLKKADPAGFDLTGDELSELRRIRAHEAANADGLTMREALEELLDSAEFSTLDKQGKQDAVVEVMGKFNQPARELFEGRNQQYLADRAVARSFKDYLADGLARQEAASQARTDVEAEGLAPSRLP